MPNNPPFDLLLNFLRAVNGETFEVLNRLQTFMPQEVYFLLHYLSRHGYTILLLIVLSIEQRKSLFASKATLVSYEIANVNNLFHKTYTSTKLNVLKYTTNSPLAGALATKHSRQRLQLALDTQ